MRILAALAASIGLTLGLAWLPMPGAWWHAARCAAYLPILAVSVRLGPIAGLSAGLATSLLWELTIFLAARNVAWPSFLVPDFALVGMFGGWLLGVRPPSPRGQPAAGQKGWNGPAQISEPAIEFNLNPIASIQSAAGLLAEADTPADVRHELAGIISTECDRLAASIAALVEQKTTAATRPQVREVDLKPIIDSAVREVEFVLCERGIAVERHIAPEQPRIECNPDQIRSLLIWLITNAVEKAQTGKKVVLDVRGEKDGVTIEVKPKGRISIARRVLDRFFGLSVEPEGNGLAAAYRIVERHSGRIEVKVNAKNSFEFLVWLPLCQGCANAECQGAGGGGR